MTTIKYYDGEKTIEVEVTEQVAAGYREICREEWRYTKRTQRHEIVSLDQIEDEDGYQLIDLVSPDSLDILIEQEERDESKAKLKAALKTLTSEQLRLVTLLRKGMSVTEIALIFNTSKAAVSQMKARFQKKLNIFLH